MHTPLAESLTSQLQTEFGTRPRVFQAPGRINLIGEHTDYNEGFVMPAAIDFRTRAAIAASAQPRIRVRSEHYAETVEWNLNALPAQARNHWSDYVVGVIVILSRGGYAPHGADLLISGDVPLGAGLSSSASIEVATAISILALLNVTLDPIEIARLCQKAENDFVGARVGVMDQLASCLGRQGQALLIDCRTFKIEYLHLPAAVAMVVSNTMVKHALASGEYNRRREECEEAVAVLSKTLPNIHSLRDISLTDLTALQYALDPILFQRARHVVTENQRVLSAAEAIRAHDLSRLGRLMTASHQSLRDDYAVSCRELDFAVDIALDLPGVFGSRMMGGGFGGCTISLVDRAQLPSFPDAFRKLYRARTGLDSEVYVCTAADGASEETL
jgi:galactokinase